MNAPGLSDTKDLVLAVLVLLALVGLILLVFMPGVRDFLFNNIFTLTIFR